MADGNQLTYQGRTGIVQALVVDGLPSCTIQARADRTWYVTAQLAADDSAALAAASRPDALCQRAQHALGLAGVGSRIEPDHSAIGVYAASLPSPDGEFLLVLEGRAVLWWVSCASSEAIRALIAAARQAMRHVPNP